MNTEESLFLNCAASQFAQKGSWREAQVAWEAMRGQLPDDFLDLNIGICRYRLGAGAELADKALDLASRLPPQPSGQAVLLAMLALHRSGRFDTAATIAAAMGKQRKYPMDLASLPTVVATTFAIEDSSGSEVVEVLNGLLAARPQEDEEKRLIKELLASYAAREAQTSAAPAARSGWLQRLKAFWFKQ